MTTQELRPMSASFARFGSGFASKTARRFDSTSSRLRKSSVYGCLRRPVFTFHIGTATKEPHWGGQSVTLIGKRATSTSSTKKLHLYPYTKHEQLPNSSTPQSAPPATPDIIEPGNTTRFEY